MPFYRSKTPTLLVIAERKNYNLAVLEDLLHGISTTFKLPITIITNFQLPPSIKHKYPLVNAEKNLTPEILKKADIALMLDGNTSKRILNLLAESKVVPILSSSLETHIYQNYDPIKEVGNCFTFRDSSNPWNIFAAIVRAIETYQFPYDWANLLSSLRSSIRS